MTEQLQESELALIRALRMQDELTFEEIGDVLGVDISTAHRLLRRPDYQFSELMLIRIRKRLALLKSRRAKVGA